MLFTIAVLILVLAITLRQATFGYFSALIMVVLTVCAAVAAIGIHEWVAAELVAQYWNADYGRALGLAVPFAVLLILLRLVTDKFIPRQCLLPSFVDRVGGGVCGFVTAMTIAGVASLSIQLLPLGRTTLGFQRVPSYVRSTDATPLPRPDAPEKSLWLKPDDFLAGMASFFSRGVFSGTHSFYRDHPDYVRSIGWATSVPSDVSIFAPDGSVNVLETGAPEVVYAMKKGSDRENRPDEFDPIQPGGGHEFRSVRLKLGNQAARDHRHLFTLRQFRLIGQGADGLSLVIPATAIQQEKVDEMVNRHVRTLKERQGDRPIYDDVLTPREPNGEVEVVFEVPTGFAPSFVEYKLGARASVQFTKAKPGTAPPAPQSRRPPPDESQARPGTRGNAEAVSPALDDLADPASEQDRSAQGKRRRRGGNVRRTTAAADVSLFGDALPMALKSYRGRGNVEIRGGALVSGHLVGQVARQEKGTSEPVTKFAVPDDKRLLQLNTRFLPAKSIFGKALAQAVKVAGNYFVTDANGNRHKIVGKYAVANVDGSEYVEVQYFPDAAGTMGGLGAFSRIEDSDFQGDYTLVYLFLVDPGVTITDFSTGGSATRADDLRSANLVAPD